MYPQHKRLHRISLLNLILNKKYATLIKSDKMGSKNWVRPDPIFYDVEPHGPLATLKGKEAVFQVTCNYMNMIGSLFGSGNQAMIVYDVDIPGIAQGFPATVLLTFHDNLIVRSELFYDSRRFIEKKEEIFS
jgi:hypothetical protein